jgi:hypothetical protein
MAVERRSTNCQKSEGTTVVNATRKHSHKISIIFEPRAEERSLRLEVRRLEPHNVVSAIDVDRFTGNAGTRI